MQIASSKFYLSIEFVIRKEKQNCIKTFGRIHPAPDLNNRDAGSVPKFATELKKSFPVLITEMNKSWGSNNRHLHHSTPIFSHITRRTCKFTL